MRGWDVQCCPQATLLNWWKGWMGLCPKKESERAWMSSFFAVTWTIWEARNEKVFRDGAASQDQARDMARFRIGWWFKNLGKGSKDPITYILLNIAEHCIDSTKVKLSKIKDWIPPPPDTLCFNVDGSAKGSPGQAAKACCLCISRAELGRKRIMIVSDSKLVVLWINSDNLGSLKHMQYILDIRGYLELLGQTTVEFSPRSYNSDADALAKQGSGGGENVINWSLY
ncbi:hypothetical protein Dsin_013951 [Dipteronia sinensis]|uniref:RNase H type-1 domain-containing protein n=1 Tax=Dipteronia sinensis TaxID=43782 RepID=A0AAE0E9G7_9ROSI|nr:hypothetical protein Dsin_013951 [Dipteronia sinensis]